MFTGHLPDQDKTFFSAIQENNSILAIKILNQPDFKLSLEKLSPSDKLLILNKPKILKLFMQKFPKGIFAAIDHSDTWLTMLAYLPFTWQRAESLNVILRDPNYGPFLLNKPDNKGKSPLRLAVDSRNWATVDILLNYKPIIDLQTYLAILYIDETQNEKLKQCALKLSPEKLSHSDKLLILNNAQLLKTFMQQFPEGISAGKGLDHSDTWLTRLAYLPFTWERTGRLNLILQDPNYGPSLLNEPGDQGRTPLQWAIIRDNWEVVYILLKHNPTMDLSSYEKIINVKNWETGRLKEELIKICHETTGGAHYLLKKSLSEKEKSAAITLQSSLRTWQEQSAASEKIKATKILQHYVKDFLIKEDTRIMKDLSKTQKEDYATACSRFGKLFYAGKEDEVTKYILQYKNPMIKNHFLHIIFANLKHPLSLFYFADRDPTKLSSYTLDTNLGKLREAYQPRGTMIVDSVSSSRWAQTYGIIPSSVSIGPHFYFKQKESDAEKKQSEQVKKLAQATSAATTIQTHCRGFLMRKKKIEMMEESLLTTEITQIAGPGAMPFTTFKRL
jgi:ankyrin repeat protein